MNNLALLVFLITIPAMIGGLIKPSLLKLEDRKTVGKYIGIAMVASLVLFIVTLEDSSQEATSDKVKVEQVDKAKTKKEKPNKEHQQLVLEFEKQIYDTEDHADGALENYQKVMAAFGEGKSDIYKAYDATSKAKDGVEEVYLTMRKIKISGDLPDNVQDILKEAQEAVELSFFVKKEGLESTLKFLDEQKPSDLQDAKDDFKASQTYMINGAVKLLEAKQKVGIDASEEEKKK